jgi:hypothetical protein
MIDTDSLNTLELEYVQRQPCAYCWPAFKCADGWDEHGLPCCVSCGLVANRVCAFPSFTLVTVRSMPRAA